MVNRSRRRGPRQRSRMEFLRIPLAYGVQAGQQGYTDLATLYTSFDKRRPFRVSSISGSFTAIKFPCSLQIIAYGKEGLTANQWSSPLTVIPVGTTRRVRYRIPVSATGWWPANSATTTTILALQNVCVLKNYAGILTGELYITIQLRPIEVAVGCPQVILSPGLQEEAGTSMSDSIEVISSDEEYFSC